MLAHRRSQSQAIAVAGETGIDPLKGVEKMQRYFRPLGQQKAGALNRHVKAHQQKMHLVAHPVGVSTWKSASFKSTWISSIKSICSARSDSSPLSCNGKRHFAFLITARQMQMSPPGPKQPGLREIKQEKRMRRLVIALIPFSPTEYLTMFVDTL